MTPLAAILLGISAVALVAAALVWVATSRTYRTIRTGFRVGWAQAQVDDVMRSAREKMTQLAGRGTGFGFSHWDRW